MTNIYLKNAAILTAASLVLRAAGMGLRVLLAAHLGSEGMGLYQLVFTAFGGIHAPFGTGIGAK